MRTALLALLVAVQVALAQPMLLFVTNSEFGAKPPGINTGIASFSVLQFSTNVVPPQWLAPGLTNEQRKMATFNMSIANVGTDWDYLPFFMSTNYFYIGGKAFLRGLFGVSIQDTNGNARSRIGYWGPNWDRLCQGPTQRPRTHYPGLAGIQSLCTTYTEAQQEAFLDGCLFDITGLGNGRYTMSFTMDPLNMYGQRGPFNSPVKNYQLEVDLQHSELRPVP